MSRATVGESGMITVLATDEIQKMSWRDDEQASGIIISD